MTAGAPTTVLVDASHLGGYSANRGIGTYLRSVLPRVAAEPDLRVAALALRTTALPPGIEHRTITRSAPNRFRQREHDLRLPGDVRRAARALDADVFWSPADDPPRRSPVPWVQFLHDLIPLAVDDPAFAAGAARWRRVGGRLRSARAVITNSQHTADDATRLLGVDAARLHVAPLGVGPEFVAGERVDDGGPPTILYVGEYGPHKGFAEAFVAVGALADAGLPHRLEMVGFLAPWYEPTVRELVARSPHPERIDLLGYVDDVAATYRRASALIVTSRYEGFCLPAVEAMASGTPVVAFANSAVAEVVAGGGVLVADGDVGALVAALRALLVDPVAHADASAHGIERARDFSWDACAHIHAEVLRAVAQEPATSR